MLEQACNATPAVSTVDPASPARPQTPVASAVQQGGPIDLRLNFL